MGVGIEIRVRMRKVGEGGIREGPEHPSMNTLNK